MMKIQIIPTTNFKVDGGAMFGVVPKTIWSKLYPADENNMCNIACRCLYVEDEGRKIIIDGGIGNKQDGNYLKHYYLNGEDALLAQVLKMGIDPDEITDVILTHLHFDHCGGVVVKEEHADKHSLAFPNATHWISEQQWHEANNPNLREKSAYLSENFTLIKKAGKLKLIKESLQIGNIELRLFFGHTIGQIVPFIDYNGRKIVFVADLIPSVANIPISYISSYDVQPIVAYEEKRVFLNEAVENDYILLFEHDIFNECCTLKNTEKGIREKDTFLLSTI